MKTIRAAIIICLFPVLLFIARPSYTSSVTPPTLSLTEALKDLADRSSLVLAGEVIKLSSRYEPNAKTTLPSRYPFVLTDVSIRPISLFKGETQKPITVVIPGGCIREDNICFSTDFVPTFKIGERVILFLNEVSDGTWQLSDYFYGKQLYSGGKSLPLEFDETVSQEPLPPEELSKGEANDGLVAPSAVSGGCSLLHL